MSKSVQAVSSFRLAATTGNVTLVAAATATLGQLFSVRWDSPARHLRLRSLDVEFLVTTAFTTPQEFGYDVIIARPYTVSPTGGTAISGVASGLVMDGAGWSTRARTTFAVAGDIRVATTDGLTSGTLTFNTRPIARSSMWSAAVGTKLFQQHDFTDLEQGGIIFERDEGFCIRNSILMGAAGVGRWTFTAALDEVLEVA